MTPPETQTESKVPAARPPACAYRIIYNWDGAPVHYSEYPQSMEQFLEKTYAPIADTQIDAHFWSIGTHEAEWPTDAMESLGETADRRYESVLSMRQSESLRTMFERGENPYEAMVERGHELGVDVYCSVRMNDNHFWDLTPEDVPGTTRVGLTKLRKEHPEWLLGTNEAPRWASTSWNMAIPDVREHKLQYIAEACRQADWDGVELDWQRHAFHLPEHDGYRLRYILTDLQRAVRRVADQIASERGRSFHVAVRVATTLESCRRIGYDIETWMKEGLCDVVIGGGNSGTDPGFEVERFQEMAEGTGVRVYPCFDFDTRQQANRFLPHSAWRDSWFRAMSADFWDRGVDGIYIFNWHANEQTRRNLLTTIGSPETLRRTDKVYSALHRSIAQKGNRSSTGVERTGAERDDRIYGETPVVLYRTMTGDGPRFHITISDDVVAEAANSALERVDLRVELDHYSPADNVEVTLDGEPLGSPQVRHPSAENPNVPADVDENAWLVWALEPSHAGKGPHEVQVVLVERDPRIRSEIVVNNVEFYVTYV